MALATSSDKSQTGGSVSMAKTAHRYANYLNLIFASFLLLAAIPYPIMAQSTGAAKAPDTEEVIRLLREEVLALRSEVNTLKQEMHQGSLRSASTHYSSDRRPQPERAEAVSAQAAASSSTSSAGQSNAAETASGAEQQSDLADTVNLIQSQVAEQAQTKVESS